MIKTTQFATGAILANKRTFADAESIKKFLDDKYSNQFNFGTSELTRRGMYLESGFRYDFSPYLKKFLIRLNEESTYFHRYARNKTELRLACGLKGRDYVYNFPTK